MKQFKFEGNNYIIVSGNDAQLHIYKIDLDERSMKITVEDANSKFFSNGKCEFDSDVLHIHVDDIDSSHCLIAIATEFGQIKVFEVKNKPKRTGVYNRKSEFREFLSGNISSNICKIQLFLSNNEEDEIMTNIKNLQHDAKIISIERSADKRNIGVLGDLINLEIKSDDPLLSDIKSLSKKRRNSLTYKTRTFEEEEEKKPEIQEKK